jgi:transposase
MRVWVREQLAPTLRPGDIVIWDNIGIHDDQEIAETIAACGARLEFLPPYSPDLSPIEPAFSKMKAWLRAAKARVANALVSALDEALSAITPQDCLGWFRHCGYRV